MRAEEKYPMMKGKNAKPRNTRTHEREKNIFEEENISISGATVIKFDLKVQVVDK